MLFYLKKIIAALVLPPAGPLLVSISGLLLRRWMPRIGSALAWTGALMLLVLSLPVVSQALGTLVCDAGPLDPRRARLAQAIVVLGGGLRHQAAEYGGDTLNRLSLERVRYAAVLARRTKLPVLVTGGRLYGESSEGEIMFNVLEREYNIPVRWVETSARNTHENAIFSAKMLRAEGLSNVLLVSHGVDSRRARREFGAAGIQVIPAPTVIPSPDPSIETLGDLIPSMNALQGSYLALYEMLGNAAMTLHLSGD